MVEQTEQIVSEFVIMNSPKITNGSEIRIGGFTLYVDKHFNWLQKKMIKWFFWT